MRGLKINEGMAVDARLARSASRPMSKDNLSKEKKKRELPDGQVDKNGNPLKFCKGLDSDWTVKNLRDSMCRQTCAVAQHISLVWYLI